MNTETAIVMLIVAGILSGVLIYLKSGYIGKTLSDFLGGIFGIVKYIVPIGVLVGLLSAFGLAKKVNNKKKKLKKIKSEKEYKDTDFDDDIDEFYTDINDFDNYYSDFKTSKR